MPTWAKYASFSLDWKKLSEDEKEAFREAMKQFVKDLRAGGPFSTRLRVKKMTDAGEIWEMTWGDDARATFEWGDSVIPGERHVVWRRIGTHGVFKKP